VTFYIEIDHKHSVGHIVYMPIITNMVSMRSFEFISDKLNLEFVLVGIAFSTYCKGKVITVPSFN